MPTALPKERVDVMSPLERSIKRKLRRGHASGGADVFDGVVEREGNLVVGRLSTQLLGEKGLRAGHAYES